MKKRLNHRVFLDRRIFFDERSKEYPIRHLLLPEPLKNRRWGHIQLDQRNQGACTGFSATMEAAAYPKPVFGSIYKFALSKNKTAELNQVAINLYKRAQQVDEWEGEDYEGSSLLAAVKAGKEAGWWSEYRWALGPGADAAANDVIMSLCQYGPVMMGTYWWSNMWEADPSGFLHPDGYVVGGHAFLLTRYSVRKDAVWTPNSWGGAGQGWIRRADLSKLLDENGEACIPVIRHW